MLRYNTGSQIWEATKPAPTIASRLFKYKCADSQFSFYKSFQEQFFQEFLTIDFF